MHKEHAIPGHLIGWHEQVNERNLFYPFRSLYPVPHLRECPCGSTKVQYTEEGRETQYTWERNIPVVPLSCAKQSQHFTSYMINNWLCNQVCNSLLIQLVGSYTLFRLIALPGYKTDSFAIPFTLIAALFCMPVVVS